MPATSQPTRAAYLQLLRAGLWGEEAAVSAPVDWPAVMALAKQQSTLGLVCQAALQLRPSGSEGAVASSPGAEAPSPTGEKTSPAPPAAIRQQMQAHLMKTVNAHASTNRMIARVGRLLQGAGIEPLLLKGQGVASYYPQPLLRQCGDIDLYVGTGNYSLACRLLEQEAPAVAREIGGPSATASFHATDKHFAVELARGLAVELHQYTERLSSPKLDAIYQRISDEGTKDGLIPMSFDGVEVLTPSDTFNSFYIFHHLWHHVIGMGLGQRQLCDWMMFLHTHVGRLDLAKLKEWLLDLQLLDVWQVFGCMIVQHLGLPAEEMPFFDENKKSRGDRLLHYMLAEGDNFGFKYERSDNAVKRKAATFRYIHRKLWRLLPIFPSIAVRTYWHELGEAARKIIR